MRSLKNILFILSLCIASSAISQQTTQYSQYVFNYFAYNPALAGSAKCFQAKIGYRTQWVGLNGAPRTAFASFHTRLKFKKTNSNRTYHGVGVFAENDAIGYFNSIFFKGAYAFHFPVARDVMASVGVFLGVQQFNVDAGQIITVNYDDPALSSGGSAFFIPYVTPGVFLNHDDWFAGFAIRQIYRNKWAKLIGQDSRNRWHLSLVGGKRFKLANGFNIVPSAFINYSAFSQPKIELNLLFEVRHLLEIGVLWRNQDALAAMVKMGLGNRLTLGYAFDFTTSKLRLGSANTHEIILGFRGCSRANDNSYSCPVFD